MEPIIGNIEANSAKVAQTLNVILADEFLLYTKTKNAHSNFNEKETNHQSLLFKTQYDQLEDIMDGIAERIHSTGYNIPATLEIFMELEHLAAQSQLNNDASDLIKDLLNEHVNLIIRLQNKFVYFRNELQELGVSGYIGQLMETHEQMLGTLKVQL
ncbi:ferritin-like domain-containing protein [Pedobacter cryoconitis]|uniref:Starvation-inducible DNA-binding protein n=1 Tax=Pedobacter cryoconitis TaxID=188932 RepID=A0A7X0J1M6_9SPHI|nr:ferritin-like domain-containing protein [Pedobacter cryoconitis]MBB6499275.1 starvation-inducible DNA-binding protein [Pedobacter cryoconitis]